jgi:hypothetical protein
MFLDPDEAWDARHDDTPATMDDAHREWHRNAGVPMGQPCPFDACHPDEYEPEGCDDPVDVFPGEEASEGVPVYVPFTPDFDPDDLPF